MSKKKRKKNYRGGGFKAIKNALRLLSRGFINVLPYLIFVAIVVSLYFGARHALRIDYNLVIRKIRVQPLDALSIARMQKLESDYLGKSILRIDLERIAKDLELNPSIKRAHVLREFPSTIKIDIERRKPVAFIQLSSQGMYGIVSDDGMILDVTKSKNDSLILIQAYGVGATDLRVGTKIRTKGFDEAVMFMESLWSHALSQKETVTKLCLDRLGNVSVTLAGGPDLRLGRHPVDRIPTLVKAIPILESEERNNIEYIDLQFDDVVVKKKGK
ncbi:MAG: FtsQ-type POTRA domain-containing protein [Candidatus Omnitrophica bacterium]|nr:FtsQ-type POTRA domain-containing protein [Candidatus Omnitrophota bacterium]MDD5670440.1 FtsQ-type POTRA domain-containing protein [Candidatus Omnitrophota bacterium]